MRVACRRPSRAGSLLDVWSLALSSLACLLVACPRDRGVSSAPGAPAAEVAAATAKSEEAPKPLPSAAAPSGEGSSLVTIGPGIPVSGPWISFYGTAAQMGKLEDVAGKFRVIDIDADPTENGVGNFTAAQLATLRAGGKNRVISYLNLGSCETWRSYWSKAPKGFVSCGANKAAHLGAYDGYPDETWMNPKNADYRRLIVEHVAARIAARGVDGFYLDNLELLSHGATDANGPCDDACAQGGLDLVRELRAKFPKLILVMQNGTGDRTRLGTTGGVRFATLLDGIAHEEVWEPEPDPDAEEELIAWRDLGLKNAAGVPFWIATVDYVGSCSNVAKAKQVFAKARARGFSPWASDESAKQKVVCRWPD